MARSRFLRGEVAEATVLPRRYDAFLYLDETQALHPLRVPVREEGEVPETFPTGV